MVLIDDFKSALAALTPDIPIHIQLGDGGQMFQLNAGDLMTALGVKPTPINTVRVNVTHLYIRSQPGIAGTIIDKLTQGALIQVFESVPVAADGHNWLRTADGRGWIAVDLTLPPDAPIPAPPISAPPAPTPAQPSPVAAPTAPPSVNTAPSRALPNWGIAFAPTQRGLGLNAGGWAPTAQHLDLIRRNAITYALICAYEPNQAVNSITALCNAGIKGFILRACTHEKPTTPQRFVDITMPILREYMTAIRMSSLSPADPLVPLIAIGNEPNLVSEGWGSAWQNGADFAAWWASIAAAYRQTFPNARIGFPALSPGGDVPNVRLNENAFWASAVTAIQNADWFGVHYYWQQADGSDIAPLVTQWHSTFGADRLIIGTEVGPVDSTTVTPSAVRIAYQKFAAAGIPACIWLLAGAGAWQNAAWDVNNIIL